MDQNQIQTIINDLPLDVVLTMKDFVKRPTSRNEAYFVGYIKAKRECDCISENDYSFLLALSGMVGNAAGVIADVTTALESRT